MNGMKNVDSIEKLNYLNTSSINPDVTDMCQKQDGSVSHCKDLYGDYSILLWHKLPIWML